MPQEAMRPCMPCTWGPALRAEAEGRQGVLTPAGSPTPRREPTDTGIMPNAGLLLLGDCANERGKAGEGGHLNMVHHNAEGLNLQGAYCSLERVGRQDLSLAFSCATHRVKRPVDLVQQLVIFAVEIIIDGHGIVVPPLNQAGHKRGRADVLPPQLEAAPPRRRGAAFNVPAHRRRDYTEKDGRTRLLGSGTCAGCLRT